MSVLFSPQLKRRIEENSFLRKSEALQSAMRFPSDLLVAMTKDIKSLIENYAVFRYAQGKCLEPGRIQNHILDTAFNASSRMEATIFDHLNGGLYVRIRLLPSGKKAKPCWELDVYFSENGKGTIAGLSEQL